MPKRDDVPTHGCNRTDCPNLGMYTPSGQILCMRCGQPCRRDVSVPVERT